MSRNKSNWDFLIDEFGNYKTDIQKGKKGDPGAGSKGEHRELLAMTAAKERKAKKVF